jgi:O-acetyl-ADP-ribose deacetylase (regulator of RNase III)
MSRSKALDRALQKIHANFVRVAAAEAADKLPPSFNWPDAHQRLGFIGRGGEVSALAQKKHQRKLLGWSNGSGSLALPSSVEEKRTLLRVMLNTLPFDLDAPALHAVEAFLHAERNAQHTTVSVSSAVGGEKVGVWQGDITLLCVDAIVNAANAYMLGCNLPDHACIDNAIHSAAGPALRSACRSVMESNGSVLAQPGQAIITPGFLLPAKFVIHTLGPVIALDANRTPDNIDADSDGVVGGSDHAFYNEEVFDVSAEHRKQLATCYSASMGLARAFGVRTLAFPCISTGVFGFPREEAAEIAVQTVTSNLKAHPEAFDNIIFNTFLPHDTALYRALICNTDSCVEGVDPS